MPVLVSTLIFIQIQKFFWIKVNLLRMQNFGTLINGHIIWSRSTYSEKIEHNEKIRHSKFFHGPAQVVPEIYAYHLPLMLYQIYSLCHTSQ